MASQSLAIRSSSFGHGHRTFGSSASSISYLAERPDLSGISDPNVIVHFKNLSKKDGLTKSKALDELISYVKVKIEWKRELEDPILDAWVKSFPRLSIDAERRVRHATFSLITLVSKSAGRRMLGHMPLVAPYWLMGCHDTDKGVSKTANDGLRLVFNSPEKQRNLRKRYQAEVLLFTCSVINSESKESLIDPKTTSNEDAEAVYNRVVACGLGAVTDLLKVLDSEDLNQCGENYQSLLSSQKLYNLLSVRDVNVRRSLLRFWKGCYAYIPSEFEAHRSSVARTLFRKQNMQQQSGSSREFTEVLNILTNLDPAIWEEREVKEPMPKTMSNLIRLGSQGGSPHFWLNIKEIIRALPNSIIPTGVSHIDEVLEAIHEGMRQKLEPTSNYTTAYECFFQAVDRLTENLSLSDRKSVAYRACFQETVHFVFNPDTAKNFGMWGVTLPEQDFLPVLVDGLKIPAMEGVAESHWSELRQHLTDDIKTSLPALSADFDKSQLRVEDETRRLFLLQSRLASTGVSERLRSSFKDTTSTLVLVCIESLVSRNGSPYGAAGGILASLEYDSKILKRSDIETMPDFKNFMIMDLPQMIFTPSTSRLFRIPFILSNRDDFDKYFKGCVVEIWKRQAQERQFILCLILRACKSSEDKSKFRDHRELHGLLGSELYDIIRQGTNGELWEVASCDLESLLHVDALDIFVGKFSRELWRPEKPSRQALRALHEFLTRAKIRKFSKATEEVYNYKLTKALLRIQQHDDDEESMLATEILAVLDREALASGPLQSETRILQILQQSLYETNEESLPVFTLSNLASRGYKVSPGVDQLKKFLPDQSRWSSALQLFIDSPPPPSLRVIDPFVAFVPIAASETPMQPLIVRNDKVIDYDRDELSLAFRISFYTVQLLAEAGLEVAQELLIRSENLDTLQLLLLTLRFVKDTFALRGKNTMWHGSSEYQRKFVLLLEHFAQPSLRNSPLTRTESNVRLPAELMLFHKISDITIPTLQLSRSWAHAKRVAFDAGGWPDKVRKDANPGLLEADAGNYGPLRLAAYLQAHGPVLDDSTKLLSILNDTTGKLLGIDFNLDTAPLEKLVLLQLMLGDPSVLKTLPQQRIRLLVRHLVSFLSSSLGDHMKSEICAVLCAVIPHAEKVSGEHWKKILDFLIMTWEEVEPLTFARATTSNIPLRYFSLQLFEALRDCLQEENTKDELKEIYQEKVEDILSGLASLLSKTATISDKSNLPLRMLNEKLVGQLRAIPTEGFPDISRLYTHLNAQSRAVQDLAFDVLHQNIPEQAKEISINVAVEKSVARLPDELLSLILQAPETGLEDPDADADTDTEESSSLFTYLAAWRLVFDHFKKASDKVKSDYTLHIKQQGVHITLLDYIFATLPHHWNSFIDASKFDPSFYSSGIEEDADRDMHWLLIHLYYLCLSAISNPTKDWWLNCTSQRVKDRVQLWTEKYFSALVSSEVLKKAEDWVKQQDQTDKDAVIVKVKERAREVTIGREIDDQMLQMVVKLPEDFPLGQVHALGVNRVAVNDKRFNQWLLNVQAAITFNNNSIVDGIVAFRRTVAGHLTGSGECSVCYSVVSMDKQLPTKRCKTCRGLFHGSCLYQWFKKSNSSSCPLCRTAFSYA